MSPAQHIPYGFESSSLHEHRKQPVGLRTHQRLSTNSWSDMHARFGSITERGFADGVVDNRPARVDFSTPNVFRRTQQTRRREQQRSAPWTSPGNSIGTHPWSRLRVSVEDAE